MKLLNKISIVLYGKYIEEVEGLKELMGILLVLGVIIGVPVIILINLFVR